MRWSSPSTSRLPTERPPPTPSPWPSRPRRFPSRRPISRPGRPTEAPVERPVMRTKSAVLLAGWLAVLASGPTLSAEPNVLRDLRLEGTPTRARVVVIGSRAPIFTVFRLAGPDRLVIDVTSADATAIRGARDGQGPVAGINVSQFTRSTSSGGRVLVTLREAKSYDVKADGNLLLISVLGEGASPAAVAQAPAAPPKPGAQATSPAPAAAVAPVAAATSPASVAPPAAATSSTDVVTVARENRPVKSPARRLTAVRAQGNVLQLSFDGEVRGYELLRLTGPSRLALDLPGVKLATSVRKASGGPSPPLGSPGVASRSAAAGTGGGKSDLQDGEVEIDGRKVMTAPAAVAAAKTPAEMIDLGFVGAPRGGRIQNKLSRAAEFQVDRPDDRGAVLTLTGVKLPKRLERSLDTSALETPIKMISTFPVPGDGQRIRVVVAADGALSERAERTPEGLVWHLEAKGTRTEEAAVSNRTAGCRTRAG